MLDNLWIFFLFFLWMPRIFLRHLLYFHRCSTCRFSNMQQLIDFAWIPRSGRVFLEPICVWAFTNSHFFNFATKNATPHSILMTKFLIFAKYATTHWFCLDPALWANFLEPISVGAVTNSHFFDFRRKFRDPSYYFDDLISVFAKSDKNQGSEKSWKFSRPLWRSPNCFF